MNMQKPEFILGPQKPAALKVWLYEMATLMDGKGDYTGWQWRLTMHRPEVPEGSVRSLMEFSPSGMPEHLAEEHDVRKILKSIEPNDGNGIEVYFENTTEVVDTLTAMDEKIEQLQAAKQTPDPQVVSALTQALAGVQAIERALKETSKDYINNATAHLDLAKAHQAGMAEAYQHALEIICASAPRELLGPTEAAKEHERPRPR